jgi:cation diffusion facilitator CzcD-associated flavoprotein CzcO
MTEHLDVLIVGAGLSGIGAAYHIADDCPWASYAVFEARDAIGGTWDLFRYPGIRSDSDMFTFSYPFRPWPGEQSIGDGAAILQYIRDTAEEFGIDRHIRFRHRIVAADWSSDDACWRVRAERTDDDGTQHDVELTCSFLFSCSGYYRYDRGHLPDFPGMDDFTGTLVHPQQWPQDLEYDGARVVVIGSGATAITLVPALAERAEHVTMLQRSPTYIASLPGTNPLTPLIRKVLPSRWQGGLLRWTHALATQASFRLSRRRPRLMKRVLIKGVERELPPGYDVDTHFTPRYDPWDQRLCVVPDGDLFRAIRDGRAEVVTDHIETFTTTGLKLTSGRALDADIIVTATGLELLFLGGIELSVDGDPVDPSERLTYKGMMLEGVPNAAMAVGYTNASWTLKSELTCDYVARLLDHMRRIGAEQCVAVNSDPSIERASLLGLSSGYVTRAEDRFPKQGSRFPWQMHQSYLADHRIMKRTGLTDDGALVFSRPSRRPVHLPVASTADGPSERSA